MAVHFHPLAVKHLQKETADCVIITFEIPESQMALFQFDPGQNITIKKNIDGTEIRRSYSICAAPFENKLCVAVKKIEGGVFSSYANNQLMEGDVLDVMPPTGNFNTTLNSSNKKNYLAFAAGSGITPILSIIKTTLATEIESSFTLVYGNRFRSSILFFEALAGLKNKYTERFNLIHVLSREKSVSPVNFGRITTTKLIELQKVIDYKCMDETFICGPQEMLFDIKQFLEVKGVDQQNIHFELFTTPLNKEAVKLQSAGSGVETAKSKISIQLDGRIFNFELAFNGESILDAALAQGADLPYACKGGVCCTCRAVLTEGKVKMDANYALEKDELAKGFILTCQSHPLTATVAINFDSR